MTNEPIIRDSHNSHPRGSKHTATLEEIHEERDSLEDEEGTNEEEENTRRMGVSSFDQSEQDTDGDDDESRKERSKSVSNGTFEDMRARRASESEKYLHPQRYASRHMSIDQRFEKNPTKPPNMSKSQHGGSQDAIDRYYERNQYTVTGRDKTHDFYNKLPPRMHPRLSAASNADAVSRISTPGALGEAVAPVPRRFDKSMYWVVFNRKKIGFRHISLVFMVLIYTLIGAVAFYNIESSNEQSNAIEREANLEALLLILATEITEKVNNPGQMTNVTLMTDYIRRAYVDLMKLEGQYKGSTFYKLEDIGNNWKWTFSSAFFFSMNVYTTTGYGSIAAETDLGKLLTIIYGFLFVPITLVVLRDLGQFFLVHLTKLYAHGLQKFRELNGDKHIDQDEIIRLPIKACLGLLAGYLAFCTIFVFFYDQASGDDPSSGLPIFDAFYFSFVSLSTIGLGDVMPNNAPFAPPVSIMFFLGMAITKVVNRSTYIAFENGIFGIMTLVEQKLDSLTSSVKPSDQAEIPKIQRSTSVDVMSINQEETAQNEMLNNLTVRSIATFMKSNADIYGGGFGRVHLRRGDLMSSEEHNTVNSSYDTVRHRNSLKPSVGANIA